MLSTLSRRKRRSSCARNGSLKSSIGNRPNTTFHTFSQSTAAISPDRIQINIFNLARTEKGVMYDVIVWATNLQWTHVTLFSVLNLWQLRAHVAVYAHRGWGRTVLWAAGLWHSTALSWGDQREPLCRGRSCRPARRPQHTRSPGCTRPPPDTETGHKGSRINLDNTAELSFG